MTTTIMISCGEPSGDLYAGALTREIVRLDPEAGVFGFGGSGLRDAGADLIGEYRGLAVTGLVEALGVLPRAWQMRRRLVAEARRRRPDAFVAVDFPDFNFRLAGAMRRLGVPVVYYVSPQLWAWRPWRIRTMRRVAARVLVIFPFETQIYQDAGIDVTFVGHPLVELVTTPEPRERFLSSLGLDPAAPTVALLPGSRPNEVHRILPPLAAAATMIRTAVPRVQFVVARAPQLPDALFGPLASISPRPAIVPDHTDNVLAAADVVVTASGTATVQTAIHERPMVIVYRLSPLTYKIGKPFVNVDTYGMANLVAGTKVVPELIQDDLTPEAVARETISLLTDPERARRMRADLATVRRRLGDPGASRRAAEEVLKVARHAKIRLTP